MKNAIKNITNRVSSKFAIQKKFNLNAAGIVSGYFTPETKRAAFLVNTFLLIFLSLSIMTGQAKAANSFVVNINTDVVDANVGDGACDSNLGAAGEQCTLRAAIQEANASLGIDFVSFNISFPNTVNLTLGELLITDTVAVNGPGARFLTVQRAPGAANFRIFHLDASNSTVNIGGMTIANGNPVGGNNAGAGIYNDSTTCTLNLTAATVKNNTTSYFGGGIFNIGTLNITRSTISGNTAQQGGGINHNFGTANISNSTVTGNTASGASGVIIGGGIISYHQMTLNNVTISNNTAGQSGGLEKSGQQPTSVRNTIIAGNIASQNPDIGGAATSAGNNLIGISDGSNGFTNGANGDKVGTSAVALDAKLGALQDNGGLTDTRTLLAGSPAIDAGSNCVINLSCPAANPSQSLTSDQRGAGFSRQIDGDNNGTATVDIGAFETLLITTAAEVVVGGRVLTAGGKGISNVRVDMIFPDDETRTIVSGAGGYYQFSDVPAGQTYIISVSAKRYTFAQATQIRSISGDANDIDFIVNALPRIAILPQ
jgi:hypothetical protein